MTEQNKKYRLQRFFQIITLGSSFIILILFALMVVAEQRPEWKFYQHQYRQRVLANSASARKELGQQDKTPRIRQIQIDDFSRIDRCTTCHLGVENPNMSRAPLAFRTHSGDLLRQHPPDRFGCTICHSGQGRAIDKKNAHALTADAHWDRPLLKGAAVQSSCGQCHLAIFSPDSSFRGAPLFQKGRRIFAREGCLGCHKARGLGGSAGPDLSEQGRKTRHEYSFRNVDGERSVSNWLREHFKDPDMVSPGSQMLAFDLPEDDIDALVTFTMGLSKPAMPLDYFSVATLNELKGKRAVLGGNTLYAMTCSACHGKNGEGKSYTEYTWGAPAIFNQDFLSFASTDFIASTLWLGRAERQMAAWTPHFSGMKNREFSNLADFVKSRRNIRSTMSAVLAQTGDAGRGSDIYTSHCLMCHGDNGSGTETISILNPDFLAAAADSFLYKTIVSGRRNTAMPGWGRFSSGDMADLIAFLRRGQKQAPIHRRREFNPGDAVNGEQLYHYRCSRCHGLHGEGRSGPAIANADFLAAASDDLIHTIVAHGRRHTAMFGWTDDVASAEKLAQSQISDIIAYLRELATNPPAVLYPGPNLGHADAGKDLFARHCSECHGQKGKGIKAPALNNQEFLNSATNGYLLAAMSLGRENTAMPSWGRGSKKNAKLSIQERYDIAAFIRRRQRVVIKRGKAASMTPPNSAAENKKMEQEANPAAPLGK